MALLPQGSEGRAAAGQGAGPTFYEAAAPYLRDVARGNVEPTGLSSLSNNLIVTEILDAARRSAKTGKTVQLQEK